MGSNLPAEPEKYLQKFSYGNYNTETNLNAKYKMVVVIPAISEYDNFRLLADSLLKNNATFFNDTLILTVVNNSVSAEDPIKENNLKLLNYIKNDLKNSGLNFSCIDAFSDGKALPEKEAGVGLARKIGMDTSLRLFDYDKPGKNIILCLDADCIVAPDYLSTVFTEFNKQDISAGYVNFQHQEADDPEIQLAIVCYEIFLRYYVLGMKYSCSPYAFHTVGSTIVCDHNSYIKVQGMNRRKAAEDFYFMEKLAKITEIKKIAGTTVFPSPRSSLRVPFGTGRSVSRFLSDRRNEYFLYDPEIFEILREWNGIFLSGKFDDSGYYLIKSKEISPGLYEFLKANGFKEAWDKIIQTSKSVEQISKQKKLWFDGFRTMKLIHFLRDNGFPNMDMFEALDILFEKTGNNLNLNREYSGPPPLEIQMQYLLKLRETA